MQHQVMPVILLIFHCDVVYNSVPVGTKHSVACSKQIFVHARHARLMYVMSTYIRRPLPSEMRQLLPPGRDVSRLFKISRLRPDTFSLEMSACRLFLDHVGLADFRHHIGFTYVLFVLQKKCNFECKYDLCNDFLQLGAKRKC